MYKSISKYYFWISTLLQLYKKIYKAIYKYV